MKHGLGGEGQVAELGCLSVSLKKFEARFCCNLGITDERGLTLVRLIVAHAF